MKTKANLVTATVFAALFATAIRSPAQPVIATQPAGTNVYVDTAARFTVTATGSPVLAYQWQFNGTNLLNQTDSALSLATVRFTDAGPYSVVISNASGAITSQVARLSVLPEDVVSLGDRELKFGQLSAPIWEAPRIDDEAQVITGDGLTMFYGSRAPGGLGNLDIWMVTRPTLASPWGSPVNLGPTVNSTAIDTGPRLSPDGLSLYFSSTRSGGSGGYDLWVTSRSSLSGPFGAPVNLGSAVNSSSEDGVVDISADNRTLVFDSLRLDGLGQDDIWMSTRADANAPWEPARNLGAPINSSSGDFPVALSRDGLLLFFKSWRPISDPAGANTVSALYVCRRASPEQEFGAPVLIRPILSIGSGGVDYSSLSDDSTTLYVGTYRTLYPDWPQVVQISITPLPQLKAPARNAIGEFRFELLGREGATYAIETSPDFRAWSPWLTTNTTGSVKLSDPTPTPEGRRFYRALSH
jgi:hypothetical protein